MNRCRGKWWPYTSDDCDWDYVRKQAKELKMSGQYLQVQARRRYTIDRGARILLDYGRVYVIPKPTEEAQT